MIRTRPPEYKVYRRARERALRRLATAYPDQYKEYLEEEKANEQANEGDIVIAVSSGASQLGIRPTAYPFRQTQAGNDGEDEGNNGGEE